MDLAARTALFAANALAKFAALLLHNADARCKHCKESTSEHTLGLCAMLPPQGVVTYQTVCFLCGQRGPPFDAVAVLRLPQPQQPMVET
jgi:hypothetical protein